MKCRIINSQEALLSKRFDGSYHNAEVNIYSSVIDKHSSYKLKDYCTEIFTSGRNKRVYTTKEYGYPFLSNSDVVAAEPLSSCKYSSKKYGYDEKAVLRKGMILTGRVGAIGQTAFVPGFLEAKRAMGSDNIIRICVKPEKHNGFIYAYLASRIGNLSFWKHATGGVQPFITDAMVGELAIPDFPESFQKEVDDLIQESARLREEATEALEEAIKIFDNILGETEFTSNQQTKVLSSKQIFQSYKRFDSQYQIASDVLKAQLQKISGIRTIKIATVASNVFIGNRGKRMYVNNNGVPFMSSSDMMLFNALYYSKLISKKTPGIEDMIVKTGDILISRSGTVGNTIIVGEAYNNVAVSEHAMRLRINKSLIEPEYVYAYLLSSHGQAKLKSLPYGSVIITLGEEFLKDIDLPILDENKKMIIIELVEHYTTSMDSAIEKERKAISMVEQEIEKWNKQ